MINSSFGQIFIANSKYPDTTAEGKAGSAKETIQVIYLDAIGGHGGMDDLDLALCTAIARRGLDVLYATCDETSARNPDVKVWTPLKEIYGRERVNESE